MVFHIKRKEESQSDLVFGHAVASIQIVKQDEGSKESYSMLLVSAQGRAWFIAQGVSDLRKLLDLRKKVIDDLKANQPVIELDVSSL